MTTVAIYQGRPKRDIIQIAFEQCGQASYEFEVTPEEYDSALRRLNSLMSMLLGVYRVDLGYNFPVNGARGTPDEDSGVPDEALNLVADLLAEQIAPSIGKQKAGSRTNSAALSSLIAMYQKQPTIDFARGTPKGAGNRYQHDYWSPGIPAGEL